MLDLQRLGPSVLAGILPRVYPQMLEVAYHHQDAGRRVYICTAASQEVADLLAHVLVLDGAIGTRSEVVDGRYTGRTEGPFIYREGKAQAVRELAEREGIDLAESWAYSDSESDLPMLRTVGHPVAVNPDAELLRIAREEGWEVMRFERLGAPAAPRGRRGGRHARGRRRRRAHRAEGPPADEPARALRRAARDPRPRAPLRRGRDRPARGGVGPRAHASPRSSSGGSASSG